MARVQVAHMCRDGHVDIYHNDSSEERCPMCRLRDDLRAALREALDGWEDWLAHTPGAQPEWDRIEFLRKQFLDI